MTDATTCRAGLSTRLSAPDRRALAGGCIATLGDLARWREADVLALHGIGPTAIPPLRQALAETGIACAGDA